ncbi:hypothetical protein [Streptomyces avermitilis]
MATLSMTASERHEYLNRTQPLVDAMWTDGDRQWIVQAKHSPAPIDAGPE